MCYFIVKKCRLLFILNKKRICIEIVVCECILFLVFSVVKGILLFILIR